MEATNSPVFYSRRDGDAFFRRRHNVTIAFAAGILLFLLPFAELRCTNYTLAKNSGLGLVTGAQWKSAMMNDLQKSMKGLSNKDEGKEQFNKEMSDGPNIFAIAALAAGIIGLVFALLQTKSRSLFVLSAGILGVIMLVGLLVQLKLQLRSQLSEKKGDGGTMGMDAMNTMITIRFTLWYYLCMISFAAAAFFGYKHHRVELDDAIRRAHEFDFQRAQQKEQEQEQGPEPEANS
jgi:hypothetical protein